MAESVKRGPERSSYPLIADHGLIGDLQTSALVSTDGSIDWFCAPRFDSPSMFGALLDHRRGGHCTVHPAADSVTRKQLYLPDTAVLVTRFLTDEGVGEVVDFMPALPGSVATARHQIVRVLRCVRGQMTFDVEIAPRFDYGRARHEVEVNEWGAVFRAGDEAATVHIVREPEDERLAKAGIDANGDLRATLSLKAGQVRGMVLETGSSGPARRMRRAEIERLLETTVDFWKSWVARSTYTGRWR